MTYEEYTKTVLRCEATPPFACNDLKLSRLMHALIGISTEIGEAWEPIVMSYTAHFKPDITNMIEECGDLLWYLALAFDALGFPFADAGRIAEVARISSTRESLTRITIESGNAWDHVKKFLMYGRPIDEPQLLHALIALTRHVSDLLRALDSTLQEAMIKNDAKLRVRFPGNFTREAALNRNLDAERAALED